MYIQPWPELKNQPTKIQKQTRKDAKTEHQKDANEFFEKNADPIWLQQNEMWEYIDTVEQKLSGKEDADEIPFLIYSIG